MGARGEATIRPVGREVPVLFTNRALMTVEAELGKGIFEVLSSVRENKIAITDLMALLQAGMEAARMDAKAGGRRVSRDDAIALFDEVGLAAVVGPVMTAVAAVLAYSDEEPAGTIEGQSGPKA